LHIQVVLRRILATLSIPYFFDYGLPANAMARNGPLHIHRDNDPQLDKFVTREEFLAFQTREF
jgi:hypothetical protein